MEWNSSETPTYQIKISLEGTELLGTKILWENSVGKLSDVEYAKGLA